MPAGRNQSYGRNETMVVNDRVWIAGLGYTAADSVFDDIAAHFGIK